MNEEQVEEIRNAIGASCEIAGLYLVELMANGFTREEAVSMVLDIIESLILGGRNE